VLPRLLVGFITNEESEPRSECNQYVNEIRIPGILLLRSASSLITSIFTIGFFSKIINTAYSFLCRSSYEALLCFSRVKGHQFTLSSQHYFFFQIRSIPEFYFGKVFKIKLCPFRYQDAVVGCSEVGVAADFLVEAVAGGRLADSSNIFI
jgi:hypothetical protein